VVAYDDDLKDLDRHGLVNQRYDTKQVDHDQPLYMLISI
jgi:hypothetical protein